jgi:ureidoacrylate peracid hydrolase
MNIDMTLIGPGPRNAWSVDPERCDLRRSHRQSVPGWEVDAEPQPVVLDPERTGLVIIDMQNDFCHPSGWVGSKGGDVSGAIRLVRPINSLIASWREANAPVVWLNWGNRPDRANLPPGVLHVFNPDGHSAGIGDALPGAGPVLEVGSWGAAVVDELVPEPGDIRVDKYRISGFWDTPLDSILRNLDLTTLLFAGVNADQCVLGTLMDAACVGYDCLFLSDCTATTSPDYCWDATVYNVKRCFGFVTTSDAVIKGMG